MPTPSSKTPPKPMLPLAPKPKPTGNDYAVAAFQLSSALLSVLVEKRLISKVDAAAAVSKFRDNGLTPSGESRKLLTDIIKKLGVV